MDAVYFLKHSAAGDLEIRYSLRSLARHLPWIRKVWIVGDRPSFLTDDRRLAEHVPHEYLIRVGPYRKPVTNFFLNTFLASLIPELDFGFLRFSDDYILLADLSPDEAQRVRYVNDLTESRNRGTGLWKESLWRTYDVLKRLKFPGYNFESHTPTYYTRKWVFEAFCDFQDYVTEDRWYGLLGPTAILNHALQHHGLSLTHRQTEDWYVGFHHQPAKYETVLEQSAGKRFLNFDDAALSGDLKRFLQERFPEPCVYERGAESPGPIDLGNR